MICRNCGNEMGDNARFCPKCGALNSPDAESGLPAAPPWEGPEGSGKKKTGLIIGAAVAAVAVIALLAVVVGGLFASPKDQVEKAFLKSTAAWQSAKEAVGMPDVEQWRRDRSIRQQLSLELLGVNSNLVGYDLSALEGLGLHMGTDYDGEARRLSLELGAHWGEDSLLSFQAAANGDELYFGSPEFTGGTFYGLNTVTLGADLAELTGDDSVRDMSFNLFELVDMMLDRVDTEALKRDMKDANKTLWESAKVKKTGARTLDVNGSSTKTAAYHITIPEEALYQYVDGLETALSAMNYSGLYEEMFRAMGIPEGELENFLDNLNSLDVYGELAGALRDSIDGDLELDVCLSGGYVSAVLYEGRIDGAELELTVFLGSNGEYVDDVSVAFGTPSASIEVQSSGGHGLKGGVYTDETTIRILQDGRTLTRVVSELSFDPKSKSDNFQWKLSADSSGLSIFVLDTAGGLEMSRDRLSLDLNDISVRTMGMEICTLAFRYTADPNPSPIPAGNPQMIAGLSEQELMRIGQNITNNAARWASDMQRMLISRLPTDLLWAMMGTF